MLPMHMEIYLPALALQEIFTSKESRVRNYHFKKINSANLRAFSPISTWEDKLTKKKFSLSCLS
jgi:hypothetical protein